jgi:hypothetical protein
MRNSIMQSSGTGSARAAASRANGAKSRGPRTAEGKARASQNALKHGLCAKKHLLLPDDSRAQFAALEAALLDDLAPEGALETLLAHRLIAAAWRLARADRLEFELFNNHDALEDSPGRALIRDGRDARVFPTLVRYRGAAQAEFFRTLKALKAFQAEAARKDMADEVKVEKKPRPAQKGSILCTKVDSFGPKATRNEPERRPSGHQGDTQTTPNEPETRANDREPMRTPNAPEVGPPADGRDGAGARNEPTGPGPQPLASTRHSVPGQSPHRLRRGAAAPFSGPAKVFR